MRQDCSAFTLVELLVTLAMTAIIAGAVYGIFGVQVQRKKVEQKSIEMQQNARVALDLIARDMRMSGFWGCMTPGAFKNTVRGQDADVLLQMVPVFGYNNLPADNSLSAKANTDVLVLSYADSEGSAPVTTPYMPDNSAAIHLANPGNLEEGDIALISDCSFTSIFQITQLNDNGNPNDRKYVLVHNQSQGHGTPNPGNWDQNLGHSYGSGSSVYPIGARYYWVTPQNELRMSMGGFDFATNTYKTDFNVQTVAENIEDLQLRYGEDSNNDGRPDQWYSGDNVASWGNVIALEVSLLARSSKMEKDFRNTHIYSFADRPTPHAYNDRYHRLLMQRVITLRNRTM